MVLPQKFRSYLVFSCCRRLIATFGLLSNCYDVVFFVVLLRYLCGGDSDRQTEFDQLKILNYSRQYIEKQES